jgi:3-(3-hydroxy-phenyl)propionate hydroxylase
LNDRVIIVGGGPVGLMAALKLVRAGVPVTVLEREPAMHAEPRASTFHAPTLELLHTVGLADQVIALGRPAPQWQYRDFETGDAAVFDMTLIADETPYPFRLQCEQFNLVKVAVEALEQAAPGSVLFGADVTDIAQTNDDVTVTFTRHGTTEALNGTWLIAADGAASTVRTKLGISFEGSTYPQVSFTVGTTFPLHEYMDGLLGVNYFWSDFGPWGQFRTKLMWRVGWSPPIDSIAESTLSDEVVQAKLKQICPAGAPYDLITARLYRVHRRIAGTFYQGRIILAGDAAHLNSPTGGFGMNGGVQDAFNLAGKLTDILNGAAPEPLLDRYTRQRRSAAIDDIQSTSDTNYRRHRERDRAKQREALRALQAIVADRDKHRAYLLDNALITSYRRSEALP